MEKRSGLSKTIRRFYGVGDLGFALMTSVGTYYSTFFMTDIARLSLASVTLISSVTAIIDSCTAWIYGAIMNSVKPMKWGRYRSWLIIFSWLLPPLFFMQYYRVGETELVSTIYFFIIILIGRFTMNFPYIANVSMINIVAKTPDEKVLMASNRATYNNASKFAWSYLGIPFLMYLSKTFGDKYAYAILSFLLSLLMLAGYWAHFKMFEGYEDTGAEEIANAVKAKRAKTSPMDLVRGLALNKPLLVLLVADLGKWCFNFVVAGTIVYYFKYVALNPLAQAYYTLIIACCSVIGAFSSRVIAKKFGAKMTVVGCFMFMAACLFGAKLIYTNMWPVIILISLAQLGYGVCYSTSSAMYADTAVYNEWKTGKNASGWIMGLQNLPLKIGGTLKTFIMAGALASGGFNAKINPADTPLVMKQAICNALLTIPAVILVASAIALFIGYKLTKEKVTDMQKEIDLKKAEEMA